MKRALSRIVEMVSDKRLTVWLLMSWVFFYVSFSIWGKEAFAVFAQGMSENLLFQGVFLLFILNLALRVFRRGQGGKGAWMARTVTGGGILLLLLGFFLSSTTRLQIQPLVGEGDILGMPWSGQTYPVTGLVASMNRNMLDLDEGTGIFSMEPRMTLDVAGQPRIVGAFPPSRFGRTWMHILQCGLAPGIRVERSGQVVREGYAALRLLPPGNMDNFDLERTPYNFIFKLVPNQVIRKGTMETGKYDLMNPIYQVRVMRGEEEVTEGLSSAPIAFDGLTLSALPSTTWALLDVVRDDGIPVFTAGIFLLLAGVLLQGGRYAFKGLSYLLRGNIP